MIQLLGAEFKLKNLKEDHKSRFVFLLMPFNIFYVVCLFDTEQERDTAARCQVWTEDQERRSQERESNIIGMFCKVLWLSRKCNSSQSSSMQSCIQND